MKNCDKSLFKIACDDSLCTSRRERIRDGRPGYEYSNGGGASGITKLKGQRGCIINQSKVEHKVPHGKPKTLYAMFIFLFGMIIIHPLATMYGKCSPLQ